MKFLLLLLYYYLFFKILSSNESLNIYIYLYLFIFLHYFIQVTDQLNVGWTDEYPPSIQLFMMWYRDLTGSTASYQTVFTWGAFDILESALYRAAQENLQSGINVVTASNVYFMLTQAQASTPGGRIAFDVNGVNTAALSIVVQALPSSTTAEIVAPSSVQTASFLYPMPTWDERSYKWHLVRGIYEVISIIIAAICTLICTLILITVCFYRKGMCTVSCHLYISRLLPLPSFSLFFWGGQ